MQLFTSLLLPAEAPGEAPAEAPGDVSADAGLLYLLTAASH